MCDSATARWRTSLYASEIAALDHAERDLRALFPRPDSSDDRLSSLVRFWYRASHGADFASRKITVPELSVSALVCTDVRTPLHARRNTPVR